MISWKVWGWEEVERRDRETTKINLCQKMKLLSSGTCSPANREFELPGYQLQCGKLGDSNSLCKLPHSLWWLDSWSLRVWQPPHSAGHHLIFHFRSDNVLTASSVYTCAFIVGIFCYFTFFGLVYFVVFLVFMRIIPAFLIANEDCNQQLYIFSHSLVLRLKYLNKYWIDWHEIWQTYLCSHQDEFE